MTEGHASLRTFLECAFACPSFMNDLFFMLLSFKNICQVFFLIIFINQCNYAYFRHAK